MKRRFNGQVDYKNTGINQLVNIMYAAMDQVSDMWNKNDLDCISLKEFVNQEDIDDPSGMFNSVQIAQELYWNADPDINLDEKEALDTVLPVYWQLVESPTWETMIVTIPPGKSFVILFN